MKRNVFLILLNTLVDLWGCGAGGGARPAGMAGRGARPPCACRWPSDDWRLGGMLYCIGPPPMPMGAPMLGLGCCMALSEDALWLVRMTGGRWWGVELVLAP